uniref:Uncharacterized protein n=1 Tax=Anguilla anguilla TaxID=7936 RepID=A0A0E9TTC1_ANGAN
MTIYSMVLFVKEGFYGECGLCMLYLTSFRLLNG